VPPVSSEPRVSELYRGVPVTDSYLADLKAGGLQEWAQNLIQRRLEESLAKPAPRRSLLREGWQILRELFGAPIR
jgi:hypothetical protein